MVGRYHQQIAVVHCVFDFRPARIEMLQSARVTLRVSTMAVEHIEVHQVRKDQSTCFLL